MNHGCPSGRTPYCSAISRSKRWTCGHSGVSDGKQSDVQPRLRHAEDRSRTVGDHRIQIDRAAGCRPRRRTVRPPAGPGPARRAGPRGSRPGQVAALRPGESPGRNAASGVGLCRSWLHLQEIGRLAQQRLQRRRNVKPQHQHEGHEQQDRGPGADAVADRRCRRRSGGSPWTTASTVLPMPTNTTPSSARSRPAGEELAAADRPR